MFSMIWKLVVLAGLFGVCPLNAAEIYKWQDEKGQWHFADKPPSHGSSHEKIEVKPSSPVVKEVQLKARNVVAAALLKVGSRSGRIIIGGFPGR